MSFTGTYSYTATYSPDDNKLRLYAYSRLPPDIFNRVTEAGFNWAPKQDLFVAPAWTPEREDLLIELAGEISDEDTSLVERAEQRADRFDEYSQHRAADANQARKAVSAIAEQIPMGQPILVGHHSEAHARRDVARIQNGTRRSITMWERSQYWADRAEAALRAAKYKEKPDVRYRRIKGLEADKRKTERLRDEAVKSLARWESLAEQNKLTPECPGVLGSAMALAGTPHDIALCVPKEHERRKSQYCRESLYDALMWKENPVTVAQVCAWAVEALQKWKDPSYRMLRWIAHYTNRIAYERAMLAEAGGVASDQWNIEVGGQILTKYDEWLTVQRVNRSGGQVTSITTTKSQYGYNKTPIEKVRDYRPPTEESRTAASEPKVLGPLVNIAATGTFQMTKESWDRHFKCGYGNAAKIPATATHGAYRQREGIRGGCLMPVFIIDLPEVGIPPAPAPEAVPDPQEAVG